MMPMQEQTGADAAAIARWAFFNEIPIPEDVGGLLVPGETPYAAFATTRDSAVFTSHRLFVRDAQGITGKKVEIYSLPYRDIIMWSSENAGTIDMTAEVKLWTRAGLVRVNLGRNIDVRRIDYLIANCVLNSH